MRAVTVEQVREAFQRNLDMERLVILSIGPQAPQVKDAETEADSETTDQP